MLAITTINSGQHRQQTFTSSPCWIGNQASSQPNDLTIDDPQIAPKQCEIHWERSGDHLKVQLKNWGRTLALDIGPRIHAGIEVELSLPCVFWVGDTTIQLTDPLAAPAYDHCLTIKPLSEANAINVAGLKDSPAPATLASWFDALGQLQCSQVGSHEFFERAARACFCPGGLDGAMVLLRKDDDWEIASSYICYPEHGFQYRPELIQQAIDQSAMVFHDSQKMDSVKYSCGGHSVIACPIFDARGVCISVLYGFRSLNRRNNRQGIRPLEACFIQLIAQSLSTAMARLESDANAAKARVLLEQAFSPRVARKLQQNPEILQGQTREVSVLFCDLRGFTSISERVGAKVTYEFLTDVMDRFSELITQHEGVIIDFYGDGLSAFWNAPIAVPNHAESACLCALAIKQCMEEITKKWRPRLLAELRVGIGIHSGSAQVGNSGSRTRLKYGPRGNTVNLASRIEAATKSSGTDILISEETRSRLPASYLARKVCLSQLAGMNQVTELHELMTNAANPNKAKLATDYEQALQQYESRQFRECLESLSKILLNNHEDHVSEFLFAQCQNLIGLGTEVENRESTKDQLVPLFDNSGSSGV